MPSSNPFIKNLFKIPYIHTHTHYHNRQCGEGKRGMRGRGRMLVTGATLIHSSSSSLKSTGSYDRLNASRDVTFPANLKELEPALFLSCLILFSRFYDKQTRTDWGQERERDWKTEGDREEGKSMLSGEPDAFANWLFVCFIRVWKRKSKLRPGICL